MKVQVLNVDRNQDEVAKLEAEITRYMLKRWALIANFKRLSSHDIDNRLIKKFIL
jgi:hypothetical protein